MRQRNSGARTRWRGILLHCFFFASAVLITPSCERRATPEAGATPKVTLHPAASRVLPAYIDVTGPSSRELSRLRNSRLTDTDWQALMRITVGDETASEAVPAVAGRYAVTDQAITFTPLFPFNPGQKYRVVFDPTKLPLPHQAEAVVAAVVSLPAVVTLPTTVVTAVHPAAEVLPENLLRMYIEFSAPMGSSGGRDFVRLLDASGSNEEAVEGAFLPVEAEFWSPDHMRYTIFFDPGRVKRGILPNRMSGRPLRAGHKYVLEISTAWPDVNRQPLKSGYRHRFRAGPAIEVAVKLSDWRIAAPLAGTHEPLIVTFRRPLDHGTLARALGVETKARHAIEGDIHLEAADTRWVFTPTAAWQAGEYSLLALAFLEDPQGNRINRAFEVVSDDSQKKDPVPDVFRMPFTIAEPRS